MREEQIQKSEVMRLLRRLGQRWRRQKPKAEPSPTRAAELMPMPRVAREEMALASVTSDSVRVLLRAAITDAEQVATSIKTRAEEEAAAEASRIIAQANLEADEIKGKAEIAAQREAENILSAANKKAEITEAETKQKALQFLIDISEEVEKEIQNEYERAYARLTTSLQALMKEGANIDTELKGKMARLGKGKDWLVEQLDAALLSPAKTTAPPAETIPPAEIEMKSTTKETVAESVLLEEETTTEKAEKLGELEKATPVVAEPLLAEKVVESTPPEPKMMMAEPAQPEEVLAEKPVEFTPPEPEVMAAEPVAPIKEESVESSKVAAGPTPVVLEGSGIYTGEVELVIGSPVELKLVSKLYNYLQTVPELRILYTRGSWDQGTTITVVLDKPLPLIRVLSETPGVAVTAGVLEKDDLATGQSSTLLKRGEKKARRISLVLKEAPPSW